MNKPVVFIGSSKEGLGAAYAIRQNLATDAKVLVSSEGVFNGSASTLDSLIETFDKVSFAVFVFAPDDILMLSNERSTRDSVTFQIGLAIGKLGRERTFNIVPKSAFRIPSDLVGVMALQYDHRSEDSLVPACNVIRRHIRNFKFDHTPTSHNSRIASAPRSANSQDQELRLNNTQLEPTGGESKQDRSSSKERTQIFISYSHSDSRWLKRLQVHVKPLERLGSITRWDDTLIKPGADWKSEIRTAINRAKVAILLVSADFLASDFISANELPPLLVAAQAEGAVIFPIIVSPCRFLQTESLARFQAVNQPSQPMVMLSRAQQEMIFVKLTEAIESILT